MVLLSSPYLPAQASRQGVSVGVKLIAQRPALTKHHLHPGHRSPRLLRLLALPRSQREELPRLFCAPNQNEGLGPRCVIQRPLDEGIPPLDEIILASRLHQPLPRAVGLACLLHRFVLLPLAQNQSKATRALVIAVDPLLGSHGARRSCGHPWPSTSAVCGPSPLGAPREYVPQFYAGVPLSWQTLLLWG